MPDDKDETPKIIVDDDWKEEARREKEKADQASRDMPGAGQIPEPAFTEIIQMIVLQASVGLGGVQDPQTGQPIPANLPLAKHYIDLLGLLEAKTHNNLDEDEQMLMERILHELRLAFVQIAGGPPPSPGDQAKTPDQ